MNYLLLLSTLLGSAPEEKPLSSPNNNKGEVGRQLAEAVLIEQRNPAFDGVTEEEVLDMVRTE